MLRRAKHRGCLRSERSNLPPVSTGRFPHSGKKPMRLVWSQPASPADRPRTLVLLGVVCIFFGGAVVGRPGPESPRVFRAAAASLVGTGLLVCLAGGVSLVLQRRKPGP